MSGRAKSKKGRKPVPGPSSTERQPIATPTLSSSSKKRPIPAAALGAEPPKKQPSHGFVVPRTSSTTGDFAREDTTDNSRSDNSDQSVSDEVNQSGPQTSRRSSRGVRTALSTHLIKRGASRRVAQGRGQRSDDHSIPHHDHELSPARQQNFVRIPSYETDSEVQADDSDSDGLEYARERHLSSISGRLAGDSRDHMVYAEPISTPISAQIPSRLKNKIWAQKYVDMGSLLPSYGTTPQRQSFALELDNNAQVSLVPKQHTRKILSISQWTSAFLRFVAVYSEKFPRETPALMKYGEVIRDLATRRQGLAWYQYDVEFRQQRQNVALRWDRMHTELWVQAATPVLPGPSPFHSTNRGRQPFRRTAVPTNQTHHRQFIRDSCWNFNKYGNCTRQECPYTHLCGYCRGRHAASACHTQPDRQSQPWSRGFNGSASSGRLPSVSTPSRTNTTFQSRNVTRTPGGTFSPTSTPHGCPSNMHTSGSHRQPLDDTIHKLLSASIAPATKQVYKHAFKLYKQFMLTHHGHKSQILPVSVSRLAQFIAFLAEQGYAASSIQTNVAGVTYINTMAGFPNPAQHFLIKKILHGSKKLLASTDTRLPITPALLKKLVSSVNRRFHSPFFRHLFTAMYLLAFHALLRVGEFTVRGSRYGHVLTTQNIDFPSDTNSILLKLSHFKHSSHSVTLQLQASASSLCPVRAMIRYWSFRGKVAGPIFLNQDNSPVTTSQFSSTLRQSVIDIGLPPHLYKPHSFRIGGATWAHSLNLSESKIQSLGRWKSTSYRRYIRVPLIPAM